MLLLSLNNSLLDPLPSQISVCSRNGHFCWDSLSSNWILELQLKQIVENANKIWLSKTEFVLSIYSILIYWKLKTQTIISILSGKAEYVESVTMFQNLSLKFSERHLYNKGVTLQFILFKFFGFMSIAISLCNFTISKTKNTFCIFTKLRS